MQNSINIARLRSIEEWLLAAPFPPRTVQAKAQTTVNRNVKAWAAYIEARDVQNRLDAIIGTSDWRADYRIMRDIMVVDGTPVTNYNNGELLKDIFEKTYRAPDKQSDNWKEQKGSWISRLIEVECRISISGVTKINCGEGMTLKGAYSDAFKRTGVEWGIGRYLYDVPMLVMEGEKEGGIFRPADYKKWRRETGVIKKWNEFRKEYHLYSQWKNEAKDSQDYDEFKDYAKSVQEGD